MFLIFSLKTIPVCVCCTSFLFESLLYFELILLKHLLVGGGGGGGGGGAVVQFVVHIAHIH